MNYAFLHYSPSGWRCLCCRHCLHRNQVYIKEKKKKRRRRRGRKKKKNIYIIFQLGTSWYLIFFCLPSLNFCIDTAVTLFHWWPESPHHISTGFEQNPAKREGDQGGLSSATRMLGVAGGAASQGCPLLRKARHEKTTGNEENITAPLNWYFTASVSHFEIQCSVMEKSVSCEAESFWGYCCVCWVKNWGAEEAFACMGRAKHDASSLLLAFPLTTGKNGADTRVGKNALC